MKFLFINYDQGASGEWLCSKISQAEQCETLEYTKFKERYKVKDCFDQEFLKPKLDWNAINKKYHSLLDSDKWRLIPTHRKFLLDAGQLGTAKILRIVQPTDSTMLLFTKYQRITKVFLSQEPNDLYFLGLVKIMYEENNSIDFLKNIHRNMDNVSLILLSHNVTPTKDTKAKYIAKFLIEKQNEDKHFNHYDALLPYEFLIEDRNAITDVFSKNFDIDIASIDLTELAQHYATFSQWANPDCLSDPEKALEMAYHLVDKHT